jgi:hypothetical protein
LKRCGSQRPRQPDEPSPVPCIRELPGTATLNLIKIMVPSVQLEEARTVNFAAVPSDKVKIDENN